MANRLAWFLTPAGKTFVSISATVAACGTGLAAWLPHTAFLEKYRDFVALRKNSQPMPVPENLQTLFTSVLEDLSLNDYYKVISKSFMVFGFDVYNIGALNSRKGTYIGLPINFTYDSPSSINKNDIFINNEPVNWNREDARQLLQSLVLSEDAKKYAIGREVLMTDNSRIMCNSLTSGVLTGSCYGLASKINTSMNLYARPRLVRVILYSLTSLFFWGVWAMQKDTIIRYYESDADEHLAQLGEKYIRGAIEYYEKTLARNKAMRTLIGAQGAKAFNTDGDEIFFFRQKHVSLTHRKEFFEKKLKEKTEGKDEKNVEEIVGNAVN
ncbi:transmembrane protein 177 [Diachasma alloeum]|uniref:transmembrane protein 177 n=1 Tax=Diachasma alloeum TaxID=454923 RepID=UPI000738155F|nr:transmembrane protein 177 [Diachasma alloeum]